MIIAVSSSLMVVVVAIFLHGLLAIAFPTMPSTPVAPDHPGVYKAK